MAQGLGSPVSSGPPEYVEFGGEVHLFPAVGGGGEHTLCGVAFDAADSEKDESLRFRPTKRRTITCFGCAAVVLACRGVRIAPAPRHEAGGAL